MHHHGNARASTLTPSAGVYRSCRWRHLMSYCRGWRHLTTMTTIKKTSDSFIRLFLQDVAALPFSFPFNFFVRRGRRVRVGRKSRRRCRFHHFTLPLDRLHRLKLQEGGGEKRITIFLFFVCDDIKIPSRINTDSVFDLFTTKWTIDQAWSTIVTCQ